MNFFTWLAHLLRFTKRREEPDSGSVIHFEDVLADRGIIPSNYRKPKRSTR